MPPVPTSPESSEAGYVFDREARRYDAWFDSSAGQVLFRAEVEAVRRLVKGLPGPWLEVGVGTGRFARALGIPYGVDPSWGVLQLARRRDVHVVQGRGEALPFLDRTVGTVLLIMTLCFADPLSLLEEAKRVLAPGGGIIVGDILRDSPWGRRYLDKKAAGDLFYRHATFYSLEELQGWLARAGLAFAGASSTLTQPPNESVTAEPVYDGIRPGASFVCLRAGVPGRKDSSLFNAIDDNAEEGHHGRKNAHDLLDSGSLCG
jgi:ubiquinone/menaquinone biosynthesis C-methylase UbiE